MSLIFLNKEKNPMNKRAAAMCGFSAPADFTVLWVPPALSRVDRAPGLVGHRKLHLRRSQWPFHMWGL